MQTFLPYPSFQKSARCLDYRRLGKQRVETIQILRTCRGYSSGWRNHPAVLMWKGYESALIEYGLFVCDEWIRRGYKDKCLNRLLRFHQNSNFDLPPWIGNRKFHRSHQSNLIRKFPEHYGPLFPSVSNDLPYEWPIKT